MTKYLLTIFATLSILVTTNIMLMNDAYAHYCRPEASCSTCDCNSLTEDCMNACVCVSTSETGTPDKPSTTIGHITKEFQNHRNWMVNTFFKDAQRGNTPGILAAMQNMTTQLSTLALQQVQIIGSFFDAKHQLETQRLFQIMTAEAHKDYHPSEELCEIGTISRSLASSNSIKEMSSTSLSEFMMDRATRAQGVTGNDAIGLDMETRLVNFINTHCNKSDNNGNLNLLCKKSSADPENANLDVDYTRTIDTAKTLDMDLVGNDAATIDQKSVLALSQNLFAHEILPYVSKNVFVNLDGSPNDSAAVQTYMDVRAFLAKQSVAMHSFASIVGLKAKGDEGAQPFIYALVNQMTGNELSVDEIKADIGETPSYDAQMSILTKKLYQQPEFYSDLYDKPANVMRKQVAIQAATLMQKRDLYDSYLRTEMSLAVMLETLLDKEQSELTNEVRTIK